MLVDILNALKNTLSPAKIYAYIRDSVRPTLTTVDSWLGYEDYELCYDGKPPKDKMRPGIVYFYQKNNKLYCITQDYIPEIKTPLAKKIIAKIKNLDSLIIKPILNQIYRKKTSTHNFQERDQRTYFRARLTADDISQEVYDQMMLCLNDTQNQKKLTPLAREKLYSFLKLNKVNVGIKETIDRKISLPYHRFEANFIAKNPKLYKLYQNVKWGIDHFATFAASQTGIRIAGITSAIIVSVLSGGALPVTLVGSYLIGMGVAIIQQSYHKVILNRLDEEVILINRYKENHKKLKAPLFKKALPKPIKAGSFKAWLYAGTKYLSTYLLEASIPTALTIFSPAYGAATALQYGILIGLSAIGIGTGIAQMKFHEDKKSERMKEIRSLKAGEDVADYKNLNELKRLVLEQEKKLSAGTSKAVETDPALKAKTFFQEYKKAFWDVINPFQDYSVIRDLKALGVAAVVVGGSGLATGSDVLIEYAALTAGLGLTSAGLLDKYNQSNRELQHKNSPGTEVLAKAQEIERGLVKEIVREQSDNKGVKSLAREKSSVNPLSNTNELNQFIEKNQQNKQLSEKITKHKTFNEYVNPKDIVNEQMRGQ